jgi:hypothetical protein
MDESIASIYLEVGAKLRVLNANNTRMEEDWKMCET